MFSAKARFTRREKTFPLLRPVRQARTSADPAICSNCHAVRHKGTWTLDPATCREVGRSEQPAAILCPACRLSRDAVPSGILHLTGSYLQAHTPEILKLIRNIERAAIQKNAQERVIRIEDNSPREVNVETASEKLAQRIGRAVSRAFQGTLRIQFSHQNKLVRLYWHRDMDEASR